MHISASKGFALAALALVSVHQSEASLKKRFEEVGSRPLTSGRIFRYGVVHPAVWSLIKGNVSDSELFGAGPVKLHAHELWETLTSAVVEALYAKCFNDSRGPKQAAQLVVYGALAHKLVAEAWCALGLDQYFDDDIKDKYNESGHGFMRYVFAEYVQEILQEWAVPGA